MRRTERERRIRDAIARLIEEAGFDAVVLAGSTTTRRGTRVHVHTWGNTLACSGLAEQTYAQLCETEQDEPEELEDEVEDDDA